MPRNSSGVYSLPGGINPVVTNTVIATSWANPTLIDIATEITNSLDRGARGGMTGQMQLADGNVGAPGLCFLNEPGLGMYRHGSNQLRFAALGVDVVEIAAGGISVYGVNAGLNVIDGGLSVTKTSNTGVNPPLFVNQSANVNGWGTATFLNNSATAGNKNGVLVQAGSNVNDFALSVLDATGTVGYLTVRGDGNTGLGVTNPGLITDVLTVNGHVALLLAATRIKGDFANATLSNRPYFQSFVVNSITGVGAIPNGSGAGSNFSAYGINDPNNSHYLALIAGATTTQLRSTISGTGTQRDLELQIAGTTGFKLAAANALPVVTPGTATPAAGSLSAGLLFGTTASFGIYYGSGAPTIAAAKGSLYLRSDGSATNNRAYIATDSAGTWTSLTTAA